MFIPLLFIFIYIFSLCHILKVNFFSQDLIHGNSMKNVDNAKKVFAALMENKTMSLEVVEYILETLTKDLIKYNSNNGRFFVFSFN